MAEKALTFRRLEALRGAIRQIDRGIGYIMAADVAVCRRGGPATTTLHYTRADGSVLYEVTKDYGSDLCAFQTARRILEDFITDATTTRGEVAK